MALDASVLTVKVVSDGIDQTTTALNNLAKAGENAETKTSKIGSGAQASAKAQVDAAQQAASAYNAIIDMMTEKSNTYYADKAMKSALAGQQEVMDQAVAVDKLNAMLAGYFQARAEEREKDRQATLKSQQDQMDAAVAQYNKEIELMNKQFDAFQSNRAKQEAAAQAKGDALNQAGQRAAEYAKIQDAAKALAEETKKLAAAEKAEQAQREAIDMQAQKQRWKDEAAAVREATAAKMASDKAEQQLKVDGEAFTAMLKKQADTIGMSTKELRDYNVEILRKKAAELGVTGQTEEYINKLKNAKGAHEGLSLATAGTSRELLVLSHELATGQLNRFYGSLMVLGERMNIMPPIWKALGTAAESLGVSFGVLLGAIAVVGVALVAGIMTYNKSATALKEMNREVVLTGSSAGATGDALYTMANRIGSAYGEFGKAREAVIAVAATGKFTADQINLIAEAAVGLEKYAGVSIEKTAAAFEKLAGNPLKITDKGFKDVSNAAMQLDEQMHFLEPTVLAYIIQLERQGEHASASRVAIAALAEEEKKRAEELKAQLTPLGSLLDTLAEKASNFWNKLLHKESLDDQLKTVQGHLATLRMLGHDDSDFGVREDLAKIKELQDKILQGEYDAADKGHKKTMDRLANEQLVYMRNLMERSKGEENLQQRLARFDNIIAQNRERAKNDPSFRARTAEMLSDESVKMMRKQVERDSMKAGPKPKSDGLSSLDQHLAETNAKYEIDKRYYDNQIKFINDLQQKHLISDSAADHAKKEFAENESKLEEKSLRDQLALIDDFHSKDTKLMEQAASKRADITKRLEKNMADTAAMKDRSATDPAAREQKEQDDADAKAIQVITQINAQTQAIQAKIDAYNRLPEAAQNSIKNEKQMQDEMTKAEIDWKDKQIEAISAMGEGSVEEVIRLTAEKKALEDRAKAQEKWEEIQAKINANANRSSALTKIATEQVRMWKDIGSEIEKSLKTAFGNSGEAAGKMFKAFAEGQADQISLTDQIRQVKEKDGLTEIERAKQIDALQLQAGQNQVGMYGNMADAASGFFDKGSTGYQAMTKAAQVLHTAEVALSLIKGVNAILTQGEGDPYTAFARMAAMTALVAGLGVAVSGGGGGGPMSSANQQKVQGTGTVLGSPTITDGVDVKLVGQKSDSIANSLKIAEKNSGLGLVVQNDMLAQLQTLNNNISSFATLVVQNSGLTGYTANTSTSGLSSALSHIPVVGGILGKIATSIFGGKTTVDDTGLKVGSASLAQVAQSGLSGSQYTNTTTSGGWFRSDKHNTDTQSLGSEFNDQITKVVLSMEDTLKTAAVGLGMGGDAFNQKLQSFVVDIGNISLKGMTGDEIQKTLQNVFSKLGDQMAQFAFSDLQKYQKIGEGLMETVVRVANDLQQVKDVFDSLSKVIPKGLDAIKTSEALISQFGSVDNLTKGVKSYINAIYTDQEKLLPIIKSVNTAMDGLGLSYVKTKEQFKQVVDSLDLTTEAGAKMFATLMNIAPAFAQTIDDTEKLANDARSALTDAYNREATAIKDTQTKMQSLVTTLKQLGSDSLLSDMSPLTPQEKYLEAKSQFDTVAQKAQSGDVDAQGQFEAAYNAFLEASKVANASGDQYKKDFLYAQKVTQQATAWAEKQVDVAKATLDALNKQVEGLINVNDGLLTVSQAIANLITALKGTPQGTQVADQAAKNAQAAIEKLYGDILHRASDSAGMQFWLDKIKEGVSLTDIANAIANSPEAKGEIKPIGATSTTQAIAPITANVGTQSVAHADVVAAINDLKATIESTGQVTTDKVDNLIGAVYDSQDKAADKMVDGVSDAVVSTKVGSSYKIVER